MIMYLLTTFANVLLYSLPFHFTYIAYTYIQTNVNNGGDRHWAVTWTSSAYWRSKVANPKEMKAVVKKL